MTFKNVPPLIVKAGCAVWLMSVTGRPLRLATFKPMDNLATGLTQKTDATITGP